jgi:hypothetical protein
VTIVIDFYAFLKNRYEPYAFWIYKIVEKRFYELYQGHRDEVSTFLTPIPYGGCRLAALIGLLLECC